MIKVDRDFILNGAMPGGGFNDPVQMTLVALKLPAVSVVDGVRYGNARIFRYYVDRLGEQTYRELVYQQWRINCIDGTPQNTASAFCDMLYLALHGKPGRKRHAKSTQA